MARLFQLFQVRPAAAWTAKQRKHPATSPRNIEPVSRLQTSRSAARYIWRLVMRQQDPVAEAGKLLSYLDTRTTAMADSIYRNPVSDYTCRRRAALEREVFFRRGAINIGLGCLLPNPGDWMTHDYTGVPILLLRRPDGLLSASLNVCLSAPRSPRRGGLW
jgi:hypothetical protein